MATIVYQSADQADPSDEGKLLFSGINFWLSARTPSKDHFKQLIQDSITNGALVDKNDYVVASMSNSKNKPTKRVAIIQKEFSTGAKVGGPGRTPFTTEDDNILLTYISGATHIGGNVIYKQIEADSWRDRWVKILKYQYPDGPVAPEDFELPAARAKEKTEIKSESDSHTHRSKISPPIPQPESEQPLVFSDKDIELLFKCRNKFFEGKEIETCELLFQARERHTPEIWLEKWKTCCLPFVQYQQIDESPSKLKNFTQVDVEILISNEEVLSLDKDPFTRFEILAEKVGMISASKQMDMQDSRCEQHPQHSEEEWKDYFDNHRRPIILAKNLNKILNARSTKDQSGSSSVTKTSGRVVKIKQEGHLSKLTKASGSRAKPQDKPESIIPIDDRTLGSITDTSAPQSCIVTQRTTSPSIKQNLPSPQIPLANTGKRIQAARIDSKKGNIALVKSSVKDEIEVVEGNMTNTPRKFSVSDSICSDHEEGSQSSKASLPRVIKVEASIPKLDEDQDQQLQDHIAMSEKLSQADEDNADSEEGSEEEEEYEDDEDDIPGSLENFQRMNKIGQTWGTNVHISKPETPRAASSKYMTSLAKTDATSSMGLAPPSSPPISTRKQLPGNLSTLFSTTNTGIERMPETSPDGRQVVFRKRPHDDSEEESDHVETPLASSLQKGAPNYTFPGKSVKRRRRNEAVIEESPDPDENLEIHDVDVKSTRQTVSTPSERHRRSDYSSQGQTRRLPFGVRSNTFKQNLIEVSEDHEHHNASQDQDKASIDEDDDSFPSSPTTPFRIDRIPSPDLGDTQNDSNVNVIHAPSISDSQLDIISDDDKEKEEEADEEQEEDDDDDIIALLKGPLQPDTFPTQMVIPAIPLPNQDDDESTDLSDYEEEPEKYASLADFQNQMARKYHVKIHHVGYALERTSKEYDLAEEVLKSMVEHCPGGGFEGSFPLPDIPGIWTEEDDELLMGKCKEKGMKEMDEKHGDDFVSMRHDFLTALRAVKERIKAMRESGKTRQ